MNTIATEISLARRIALLLLIPIFVSACTGGGSPMGLSLRESSRIEYEWKHYVKLAPHKSLAFAGEAEGRYVTGYGFGKSTVENAKSAAMADCQLRRADKNIQFPCEIVAIEDVLIEGSIPSLETHSNPAAE